MQFDKRKTATILAALRYWQREGLMSSGHEQDIATDDDTLQSLSRPEIDVLCEQINIVDEPITIVVGCEGGLVQGASSNVEDIRMIVLDYDTEGADEDEVTDVPQSSEGPGTAEDVHAVVGLWDVEHNPSWVKAVSDCEAKARVS